MSTNASKLSLLAPNVNTSGTVEATTLDGLDLSQFLRKDSDDGKRYKWNEETVSWIEVIKPTE